MWRQKNLMSRKFLLSIAAAFLLPGCATHRSETAAIHRSWELGDTAAAQKMADGILEEKTGSGDELIWLLEDGAIARANFDLKKSADSFARAYAKIQAFEAEPQFKISAETRAFIANQSYLPYRSYNYDKIMLSIYQSLNFMEMKDFERARVELRRLKNFQDEAARANEARIEKARRALMEAKNSEASVKSINTDAVLQSKTVKDKLAAAYGGRYNSDPRIALQRAKSVYVNPFGYWLGGVFLSSSPDADDRAIGADCLRVCAEMLGGESDALNADAAASQNAQKPEGITYIVFEAGSAPERRQFRLDLPLYLASRNLPHVSANFPYLKRREPCPPDPVAIAGGRRAQFETIADLDEIVEEEFYIELPTVIAKTVLSAAAKAAGQYFAARAAGDYGIFVNVGMSVLQILANDADLRTWTTLPKKIKIARVPTPADGKIMLDNAQIQVNKKGVNIVYVKSTSSAGKKYVRAFDFNPPEKTQKK